MKNKGFTLLELLGVIIILAILVTLAFPSVINFIKSSTAKKDKIINDLIISAAESYINDNSDNLYITSGSNYCVTVDELVETQYLNSISELKKYPKETRSVKVTYEDTYKYEIVDSKSCFVCNLLSDSDGSNDISIGDKYLCKVKDNMEQGFENGYYFYVLSFNKNGTTNLIMDRNIYYDETNDVGKVATEENQGFVAWYEDKNHSFGPVTAMTYLHNATKDWTNISNIIMNYEDENINSTTQEKGTTGYGKIETIGTLTLITSKSGETYGTIENLKSRMPMYNEVVGPDKCSRNEESCPLWLVNFLYYIVEDKNYYETIENKSIINGVYGYWLLSSFTDSENKTSNAWHVYSKGNLTKHNVDSKSENLGVRPVITVSNGLILN